MSGTVTGKVRIVLRLEGLCILLISLLAYAKFGAGWGVWAIFFLTPDLSLLGYVAGPRAGSALYNSAHSYVGAALLLASGLCWPSQLATTAGIIWIAHIGFDRALGYGLKYASGFGVTHLGLIGRAHPRRRAGHPPRS